jgi:hydrogenase/urease accessory protein HupE
MTGSGSHLINVVATPLPARRSFYEGGWGVIHGSERRVPERSTARWLQGVRIYEMASKPSHLWLVAIFLLASLLAVPTTSAHEARPAYLEIKETSPNQFSVLWRTPVLAGMRLPVVLTMPGDVKNLKEPVEQELADSLLERRWINAGATGLAGKRIQFTGLQATMTDVLVRVELLDGRRWTALVHPSQPWFEPSAAPSKLHVAGAYLRLGVEHIWGGIDHLLFILALMILVKGTRRLIATVTAFTVAHSITLAGATLGFVHVSQKPVEAAIALSIVFVASEIVHARQGRQGLTERWPWLVAFTFGLLHGFGFAGALDAVGLPQTAIPVALLFFNVGVEIGQLLFIAAILSLMTLGRWLIRRAAIPQPTWAWRVAPYSIGGVAAFWMIQRIAAF